MFAILVFVIIILFVIFIKPSPTGRVIKSFEGNETTLKIIILSPEENKVYAENSTPLIASLNQEASSVKIYLDSGLFAVFNGTDIQADIKNLLDGNHEVRINAILGVNETDESVSFSVDTKAPQIISQLPEKAWPSSVVFSVNYTELNLNSVKLFWRPNNGVFNELSLTCESGISKLCSANLNLSNTTIGSRLQYYFVLTDSLKRETRGNVTTLNVTSCIQNWIEGEWQACQGGDIQYKEWTDANNCSNITGKPERINQTCDYCTPNWNCADWSECSNGEQTRTCSDTNSCGEAAGKPSETRSCTEEEEEETETTASESEEPVTPMRKAAPVSGGNKGYLDAEKLKAGIKEEVAANEKLEFNISGEIHQIIIKAFTGDSLSIEVSSEPQSATLKTGETKEFDVTGDGKADIEISYLGLRIDKAVVSIKQKATEPEAPTEPTAPINTTEKNATGGKIVGATVGTGKVWKWVIVVILVLGVAYGVFFFIRKYRKKLGGEPSKKDKAHITGKVRKINAK